VLSAAIAAPGGRVAVTWPLRDPFRPPSERQRISPALFASAAIALTAVMWFSANIDQQRGPRILLWLPLPLSGALAAAICWRAAGNAVMSPVTRRFWRSLAGGSLLVGIGSVAQAVDGLTGAMEVKKLGPVTVTFYAVSVALAMWALYRLPVGAATRGQRFRLWLDASTVMLATAVYMWHFSTRLVIVEQATVDSTGAAALLVVLLALVAVFAVAKVALSGDGQISRVALRLLALGMLIGSLGSLFDPLLADRPTVVVAHGTLPMVMFFVAWGAERQLMEETGTAPASRRRRGSFTLLPYGAVAAVDGLLLTWTWLGRREDLRTLVLAAVFLTALVVLRQVTAIRENSRLLARLDHGAKHDALTQLANRTLFADRLEAALRAAEATGDGGLSVALIDLDDFKIVNDTLGHGVGDALLVAVGERLAGSVRVQDTVARLGGDEFVVVLDSVDPAGADQAVERIMAALASPVFAEGHELLVRASVGIADGRAGDTAAELLRRADVAMYAAKKQGGNEWVHYTQGMPGGSGDHAYLGAELRQALQREELFLVYQPMVTLDGEGLAGVEALVRWAHPERGTLGPVDFVPVAERTGLIVPLGRWVLREACRQAVAWAAAYGDAAPGLLNVNVSARELREPGFVDEVMATLAETGMEPSRLALEVTETTVFALGASVVALHALRRLGIRIALDDFGTGQSTLSLLQNCPVDELKLDRSFTQADSTLAGRNSMAAAVIHLARALDLQVVAEGVETPAQADRLRALGYRTAQGYYFAKPMPADVVDKLLAAARTTPRVASA
jgi:diguanylate cyclase (GGDEF)-like protein